MTIFIEEISQNDSAERSYIFPFNKLPGNVSRHYTKFKKTAFSNPKISSVFFHFSKFNKADWLERKSERSEPEALGPYPLPTQSSIFVLAFHDRIKIREKLRESCEQSIQRAFGKHRSSVVD